ncbi:DinB family protein [Rhodopirellula islandica]|nr:DinB family protein [Rhodopirellula islandica]
MNLSDMVFRGYLGDLEDADLMRRPGPGCNHLAWQVGHLVVAEVNMLGGMFPDYTTELPEGFEEVHGKDNASCEDASQFNTLAEYLELMTKVRANTLAALEAMDESKLDDPAPEQMRAFCPTVGDMMILIGMHPMMHAGQIVPVRRESGKPVLF